MATPYFVYILQCADETLYTGITTDVDRRLKEHQSKKGARYTRAHAATRVVYVESCADRSVATRREVAIKKMTRAQKLALVTSKPYGG